MMFRQHLLSKTTILAFALINFVHVVRAGITVDSTEVKRIAAMLPKNPTGLGRPISDRAAWDKIAAEPSFQHWLAAAHREAAEKKTPPSDDLFLEFSRNGNRTHWQDAEFAIRSRLSTFALAECVENKGAFLQPLEETIQQICAEKTWVYPAHDGSLGNFKGTKIDIDLGSSRVGWDLATIKYLLGEKLSPATRKLMSENITKRVLQPYRNMVEGKTPENGWMRVTHNWNAVCHAGVIDAALAELSSREDRAFFVAASSIYITNFISGFGTDGYCSEGMGYWNYGFGHYLMMSETIRQATAGKIDLIADPSARLAALFGRRAEILNGIYPSIADCHPGSRPDPQIETYICRRFGLKPCDMSRDVFVRPGSSIFTAALFCFLPQDLPPIAGNTTAENHLRTWFSQSGVLLCRQPEHAAKQFAVSLKGGNNAEHHNHNDVGSYIVVVNKSMVVVDPGAEVYTRRTFGPQRYDSDLLNSFGHDVPVIAGQLQKAGAKHRAEIIKTNFTDAADTIVLDLKSAYVVPTLTNLTRSFTFNRGTTPSLVVKDAVAFTKPESFETALLTWGKWEKVSESQLLFREATGSVRVNIDTGGAAFELTNTKLTADATTPEKATRIGIRLLKPVSDAHVTLTITPVD